MAAVSTSAIKSGETDAFGVAAVTVDEYVLEDDHETVTPDEPHATPVLDAGADEDIDHVGAWRTLSGVAETAAATRPARKALVYILMILLKQGIL